MSLNLEEPSLLVSIEINGRQIPVGRIREEHGAGACFSYLDSYLNSPLPSGLPPVPVSVSLPLQAEPFSEARTRTFFDGLLPEGFTRRSVAKWMHAGEDDYLAILAGLGKECLGAVKIREEHASPDADSEPRYEKLSMERVRELAQEGAAKSAELVTRAHLSLTGASGKAGLYLDEAGRGWYLPTGDAPSTHIVKQSHVRLSDIVTNEQLCLMTAAALGLETAASFIINTGEARDGDVLLATRRFDRVFAGERAGGAVGAGLTGTAAANRRISGLPAPFRLHQEDFAQALGIPAQAKYEVLPETRRVGGAKTGASDGVDGGEDRYLQMMFRLIRTRCADPIRDQLRLWNAVIFDYLIGNTDCHLKNHSLLYAPDLRSVRYSPLYDLVSTTVYENTSQEMAFSIGGTLDIHRIDRECFRRAASTIGLGERLAMRQFDAMCQHFEGALTEAARQLESEGFVRAGLLRERMLRTGGYAEL